MTTTRLVRAGGRRGMRCLLAGSAMLLAVTGTAAANTTSAAASQVTAAVSKAPGPPPVVTEKPCVGKKAIGPFVASGAQVYSNGGKGHKGATIFRSYGPTVAFTLDAKKFNPANQMDEQEIKWAAQDWCANTVRIQVNQDLLIERDFAINQTYLKAIEAEVQDAVNYGLVVVLNDSTESSAYASKELEPDMYTDYFWQEMARLYGHGKSNPQHIDGPEHVIFDLFNEPRDSDSSWQTWYYGPPSPFPGPPPNVAYLYQGMEFLATYVRSLAPHTLFWVEGPQYSDSFAGMYPNYRIKLRNVVYAIHHPTPLHGKDDAQAWTADYGYLLGDHLPVVEGEWTNFAGSGSECWRDAIPAVGNYLDAKPTSSTNGYLAAHGIGLSAYTLNSGRLLYTFYGVKNGKVTTTSNPLDPTVITKATKTSVGYSCKASDYSVKAKTAGTEGFGQDAYNFFKAKNQQA